jgi:cytochrome c556
MRRAAVLSALALTLAACHSGGAARCPEPSRAAPPGKWALPAPAHLPQAARNLLAERMQRHGAAMTDMVWAALFLDYESATDIAQEIAGEPRLARPLSRDASELNAVLPEAFFELQDELATRAAALAEVAPRRDPAALSAALGQLTDTCMRCHATYLREPER